MQFNPNVASFLLALVGAASGWVVWWFNKSDQRTKNKIEDAEKALNEKRDFNHLVNNQIDISRGIATGFDDLEHQVREVDNQVREIKAYVIRNTKATDKVE
ncbi:MAG: hypothetical protein V7K90_18755 [Nostoc sp.]|uniref:hypothetical protein n=1 Tax=Nostoc sp. TaxID=1180 RepID=UPI002FFCAAD0